MHTRTPCFCWGVMYLLRSIWLSSWRRSRCTVSQLAEYNSWQMPSIPGDLCFAPDRIAVITSSKFIGCSRLSAGAASSGFIWACSAGRLSRSMSIGPNFWRRWFRNMLVTSCGRGAMFSCESWICWIARGFWYFVYPTSPQLWRGRVDKIPKSAYFNYFTRNREIY